MRSLAKVPSCTPESCQLVRATCPKHGRGYGVNIQPFRVIYPRTKGAPTLLHAPLVWFANPPSPFTFHLLRHMLNFPLLDSKGNLSLDICIFSRRLIRTWRLASQVRVHAADAGLDGLRRALRVPGHHQHAGAFCGEGS